MMRVVNFKVLNTVSTELPLLCRSSFIQIHRHTLRHHSTKPSTPVYSTDYNPTIDPAKQELLQSILTTFRAPVRYAFAYGSGVFSQLGYPPTNSDSPESNLKNQKPTEKPMIDLIFGVTHVQHWHSLNLQQNRHHYSMVGSLGSKVVSTLQDSRLLGAGVYFNPYVELNGVQLKYGVVSIDRLNTDLLEWETLYLAGRMHKPIYHIRPHSTISLNLHRNRLNALRLSLLLLPAEFHESELFHTIASLSYIGDFRMKYWFMENKNKIYNIVEKQKDEFRTMYKGIAEEELAEIVRWDEDGMVYQDNHPRIHGSYIQKLPKLFNERIQLEHKRYLVNVGRVLDKSAIVEPKLSQEIATSPELEQYIRKSLNRTTSYPALAQSIKGVATAGIVKSIVYGMAKVKKGVAGKSEK